MSDVTFQREEYKAQIKKWGMIDDVCAGSDAIKKHDTFGGADNYLPTPNPFDTCDENKLRFQQYKERAVWYGATRHTLHGMLGQVFRKNPQTEIPASTDYLKQDTDGAGVGLNQQAQAAFRDVMKKGRAGLLVDYPEQDRSASVADLASGSVRATIHLIAAKSITNWQTMAVGGRQVLSMVVISESVSVQDGFETKHEEQFRVLRLDDFGYVVEIYRKAEESGEYILVDTKMPTDGSGRRWTEIPFCFIGSENNDHHIDPAPLYDLAKLNIAHYRNSADYEDSVYFVGQAQPVINGLHEAWRDHLEKTGMYIGSRSPILLPKDSDFKFEQAEPNTLVKEAMATKEAQMVALGARLIERGGAVKTATQAQGEQESEHSILSLVAENVSAAYEKALAFAARYMNAPETDITFELNTDFTQYSMDAQLITAIVGAWQSGRLPPSDMNDVFRKLGLIDSEKTDEQVEEELGDSFQGLGLDGAVA